MSEIAIISYGTVEKKKEIYVLKRSENFFLKFINAAISIMGEDYYKADCFILRMNNNDEVFIYSTEEDYVFNRKERPEKTDALMNAVNSAMKKGYRANNKYISLLLSGKINKLILNK